MACGFAGQKRLVKRKVTKNLLDFCSENYSIIKICSVRDTIYGTVMLLAHFFSLSFLYFKSTGVGVFLLCQPILCLVTSINFIKIAIQLVLNLCNDCILHYFAQVIFYICCHYPNLTTCKKPYIAYMQGGHEMSHM